jgi:hypothetical protein
LSLVSPSVRGITLLSSRSTGCHPIFSSLENSMLLDIWRVSKVYKTLQILTDASYIQKHRAVKWRKNGMITGRSGWQQGYASYYELKPSCHPICPVVNPKTFFTWVCMVWEHLTVSKSFFFVLTVKYSKTIETQVKVCLGRRQGKWDDKWVLPRTEGYLRTTRCWLLTLLNTGYCLMTYDSWVLTTDYWMLIPGLILLK